MGELRIGIIGCGHAARVHLGRLAAIPGVHVVGCADPDAASARALADLAPKTESGEAIPTFADQAELLRQLAPDALAIFTPHLAHYRSILDALQAGCHVFVEKPLSTNVQEAVDIVNVARARGRRVGVGHQFRLLPSLQEARQRVGNGAIGSIRLVVATLAQPWLASHSGAENSWRHEPKVAGGGILADSGDHLIDAMLWSLGQVGESVAAVQSRLESGLDLVTAAAIRLADGTPATLGLSGNSPGPLFEINYFGERGRMKVTENRLIQESGASPGEVIPLHAPIESIDSNFVAAILNSTPLCCPAEEAMDTVRLLEAITRSAATGQVVRLG
jgi:predicted dehydrogenase